MFQDNLQAGKFLEDFSGFGPEFARALKLVEEESRIDKLAQQKPRKFEESEKSQKSIKSMIVCDENKGKPKKEQKKSEDCKGKQSRKGPVHLILMSKLE